jgi:hypothetical protein
MGENVDNAAVREILNVLQDLGKVEREKRECEGYKQKKRRFHQRLVRFLGQ